MLSKCIQIALTGKVVKDNTRACKINANSVFKILLERLKGKRFPDYGLNPISQIYQIEDSK